MKMLSVFLLLISNCYAHFDFSYGFSGRSYPSVGGQANFVLGYNQLLWGEAGESKVAFGMIRPFVKAETSTVTHVIDTAVEFFPISFLGLMAGRRQDISAYDKYTYFDCDNLDCKGVATRDYTRAKFALALGPLSLVGKYSYVLDKYEHDDDTKNYADFIYVVHAPYSQDAHIKREYMVGLTTSLGFFGVKHENIKYKKAADEYYHSTFGIYGTAIGENTIILGLGSLGTSHLNTGAVVYFSWSNTVLKKSSLF